MNRFFAMMRYSKKLLILSICFALNLCLVLGICVFDVVQLIQISSNAVLLSSLFVPLNILLIVLLGLDIIVLIAYLVVSKFKEKKHGSEEN